MSVSPDHREQLERSAIDEQQIAERGDYSVETRARLAELGMGRTQRRVPALVLPTYPLLWELGAPLARPHTPQFKGTAKAAPKKTTSRARAEPGP